MSKIANAHKEKLNSWSQVHDEKTKFTVSHWTTNNHCDHTSDTLFVAAGCFQSARTRYSWLSFYTLDDHSGSSVVHVSDCMLVGEAYTRRGPKVWPAAFQHLPQQGVSQRIMSPREMACFSPALRPHSNTFV